jgi:hypothetical protein
MLREAARVCDPVGIEFGLYLGHHFGFAPEQLAVLCELAKADWHQRHEDVVDALSQLNLPGSEEALYAAATSRHAYRDYDESESLGVKATWALSKLQTLGAIETLGALLRDDRAILCSEARQRLEDLARSGTPELEARASQKLASERPT